MTSKTEGITARVSNPVRLVLAVAAEAFGSARHSGGLLLSWTDNAQPLVAGLLSLPPTP